MSNLFWWQRNEQLDARLNDVVETCERTRKSIRPKQLSVEIDTSFLDQPPVAQPVAPELHAPRAPKIVLERASEEHYGAPGVDVEPIHEPVTTTPPLSAEPIQLDEEDRSDEFALLELAVAKFECAQKGETDALKREAAAYKDADDLRAMIGRLEAKVTEVETELLEADRVRDEALRIAEQTEQKLSELDTAAQRHSDAVQSEAAALEREEIARQDADQQREITRQLETKVAEIEAARLDTEAQRDAALFNAEQTEQKLNDLDTAAKHHSDAEAAAVEREAAARNDADEQREITRELEAEFAKIEAAQLDTEAQRDAALKSADKAEQKLHALGTAAKQLTKAMKTEAYALERETAALRDADEQRANSERLEARVGVLEAAVIEADTQRDDALRNAEHTEQKLSVLAATSNHNSSSAQNEADALEREFAARKDADDQRANSQLMAAQVAELEAAVIEADTQRHDALRNAEQTEQKLSVLAATSKHNSSSAQNESDALERETVARKDADEQRANSERLQAQVGALEEAVIEADTQRHEALRNAEQSEQKLSDLTAVVEQSKQGAQSNDAAVDEKPDTEASETSKLGVTTGTEAGSATPLAARLTGNIQQASQKQQISPTEETGKEQTGDNQSAPSADTPARTSKPDLKPEPRSKIDTAEALRSATDKPLIFDPADFKPAEKIEEDAKPAPARTSQERREKRIVSRLPATFRIEDSTNSRTCAILDKSSSGARLEIKPDTYNKSMGELNSGDKLTLSFGSVREQTSVLCTVVWVTGKQCGVKYSGQFVTQDNRIRKTKASAGENTGRFSKSKTSGRRSIF